MRAAVFACFVAALAGCQSTGFSGSDPTAPLPEDIRVIEPRKDIDPRKAAFMGRWEGVWFGSQDRVQHILIVETLSEDTFSAVSAMGDSMGYGGIKRHWRRVYGVAQPGKLIITTYYNTVPIVTAYELRDDGTLSATFQPGNGQVARATMVKVRTGK